MQLCGGGGGGEGSTAIGRNLSLLVGVSELCSILYCEYGQLSTYIAKSREAKKKHNVVKIKNIYLLFQRITVKNSRKFKYKHMCRL